MRQTRSILLFLVVAVLMGCGDATEPSLAVIPVTTQPDPGPGPVACMDALASGTLVADARWGVALGQTDGSTMQVLWPHGFSARQLGGVIELLDEDGVVVGRVGDRVSIGGGMGVANAWFACGAPSPASSQ